MWLVKWSGSVLFDGLLQYGCSVLGSAAFCHDNVHFFHL